MSIESTAVSGQSPRIELRQGTTQKTVAVSDATLNLYQIITEEPDFAIAGPCGGKGRCGKCRVTVSTADTAAHQVLACLVRPVDGMCVEIPRHTIQAFTKAGLVQPGPVAGPIVSWRIRAVPLPSLESQLPDLDRYLQAPVVADAGSAVNAPIAGPAECNMPPNDVLAALPHALRAAAAEGSQPSVPPGTVVLAGLELRLAESTPRDRHARLIDLSPVHSYPHADHRAYIAAIDIGTTTVACYLLDSESGDVIAAASELNRQGVFGADVISRIEYATQHGTDRLQQLVVHQIQDLIQTCCETTGAATHQVAAVVIAANTTMVHLLFGLDPRAMAQTPFVPVVLSELRSNAANLGFNLHRHAQVVSLPGISAYVGADIVAGIIATQMSVHPTTSILIDVGTNGEIVLASHGRMWACSTAAGPAFEGGGIEAGVGGVAGAVRTFARGQAAGAQEPRHTFRFETIGNAPPVGLCGAGIVDVLAMLLRDGVVDETGRFLDDDELSEGTQKAYAGRLEDSDEGRVFVVSETPRVVFTSKDVRQVQLAKAAVSAGVRILLMEAGLDESAVSTLYLAGGFGNAVDATHAAEVGLFPPALLPSVRTVGNTAGLGACMWAVNDAYLELARYAVDHTRYIELSGHVKFNDLYVEEMMFPVGTV